MDEKFKLSSLAGYPDRERRVLLAVSAQANENSLVIARNLVSVRDHQRSAKRVDALLRRLRDGALKSR